MMDSMWVVMRLIGAAKPQQQGKVTIVRIVSILEQWEQTLAFPHEA